MREQQRRKPGEPRRPRSNHVLDLHRGHFKMFLAEHGVAFEPGPIAKFLDISQPTAYRICHEADWRPSVAFISALTKRIGEEAQLQRFFRLGRRDENRKAVAA